jgi:hypothetical protein
MKIKLCENNYIIDSFYPDSERNSITFPEQNHGAGLTAMQD